MPRQISRRSRITIRLTSALLLLLAVFGAAAALAQEPPAVTWTRSNDVDHLFRLFTPSSGALFAVGQVKNAFLTRSDDGGVTWRFIDLPARSASVNLSPLVDPSDHTKIYYVANAGLYKTHDDAATWHVILPIETQGEDIRGLEVSPADPNTVYVQIVGPEYQYAKLMRSADGGATWEVAEQRDFGTSKCDEYVSVLRAHPKDPSRLFRVASCSGITGASTLRQSADRGATWTDLYTDEGMRIVLLAIGGNGAPGRLILGLTARSSAGGSAIIRSDDDGATWTTVLNNTSDGDASDGGADVMISGLTIDQTNPDRVLASLVPWGDPRKFTARMMMSLDGGLTWTEISSAGMYYPQDVASGIDGKTMFVADGAGAWRAPAP